MTLHIYETPRPWVTVHSADNVPREFVSHLQALYLDEKARMFWIAKWIAEERSVPGRVAVAWGPVMPVAGWAYEVGGEVSVFVAKHRRLEGIGRLLVDALKVDGVQMRATYHDDASERFFRRVGVKATFYPNDDWLIWCELAPPNRLEVKT